MNKIILLLTCLGASIPALATAEMKDIVISQSFRSCIYTQLNHPSGDYMFSAHNKQVYHLCYYVSQSHYNMTDQQLFAETDDAYLSFIHLGDGVNNAVAKVAQHSEKYPTELIDRLIRDGDSWREQLLGLVIASLRGLHEHYDALICGFQKTRGISIVPISAVLAIAIRNCQCEYSPQTTDSLDRNSWDGEIGFALDWLHYTIGIGAQPSQLYGPNYGQNFTKHFNFYAALNKTSQTNEPEQPG